MKCKSGSLERFQNNWVAIIHGMKKPPPDDVLEHFYYEAIRDVAELSEDIAHYDRLDEGSGGDRSYQWLYQVVERRVRQKRTRQNMLEMQNCLGSLDP